MIRRFMTEEMADTIFFLGPWTFGSSQKVWANYSSPASCLMVKTSCLIRTSSNEADPLQHVLWERLLEDWGPHGSIVSNSYQRVNSFKTKSSSEAQRAAGSLMRVCCHCLWAARLILADMVIWIHLTWWEFGGRQLLEMKWTLVNFCWSWCTAPPFTAGMLKL